MYAVKGTCLDTAIAYVQVEIPSEMEIPNVFTPNGDNVNDVFFLKATNLDQISILIYNRWGNVIFEMESDNGNIEWDGKYQSGKDAADGTYFYVIKATGKDGTSYDKKGTISLYR
jgi:gliding motility-associated-like protein